MPVFSAHYALGPAGKLVKNPLLRLTDHGEVVSLESLGETYVEVHGAQFFSGLLIPEFLADLRNEADTEITHLTRRINQLHANGVKYVVLPTALEGIVKIPYCTNYAVPIFADEPNTNISHIDPWEDIRSLFGSTESIDLVEVLSQYLIAPWTDFAKLRLGGAFEKGFIPGVLCVSGIDWKTHRLLPHCSIKRLM